MPGAGGTQTRSSRSPLPPPYARKGAQGERLYLQCFRIKEDLLVPREQVALSNLCKRVVLCFYKFGRRIPNLFDISQERAAMLRAVPPTGSAGNGSLNLAGLCKPELPND